MCIISEQKDIHAWLCISKRVSMTAVILSILAKGKDIVVYQNSISAVIIGGLRVSTAEKQAVGLRGFQS